jgi:hypothetical protein
MALRAASMPLLLVSLLIGPAALAQDAKSAESFLRTIYAAYTPKGHPVDLAGPKAETILESSLAALLRTDQKLADGEVGAIESDPICACQDFDIRSVAVAVTPDGADKVKATASFKNFGKAARVDFDLVSAGSGWRIFDIHEEDIPSLRKLLEDDIAAMKTEKAKVGH